MADITADHVDEHDHHPTGWRRYLYSTNHKDIGTLYLIFAVIAGLVGTGMSVLMRMELMYPGDGILGGDHNLYNVLVTRVIFIEENTYGLEYNFDFCLP